MEAKHLPPFRETEHRIEVFSVPENEVIALQMGRIGCIWRPHDSEKPGERAPANTGSAVAYIVLLEDYKEVAEVMCDALRSEGHRCFVIRSKRVAERFLSRVRPDLVVVDCLLVGGDGLELAEQLASVANIPLIIISGDEDRAAEGERAGFLCLRKPFRMAELVAAVSILLTGNDQTGTSNGRFRVSPVDRADYGSP
jgi:CheY-like chemotaxis protein